MPPLRLPLHYSSLSDVKGLMRKYAATDVQLQEANHISPYLLHYLEGGHAYSV